MGKKKTGGAMEPLRNCYQKDIDALKEIGERLGKMETAGIYPYRKTFRLVMTYLTDWLEEMDIHGRDRAP